MVVFDIWCRCVWYVVRVCIAWCAVLYGIWYDMYDMWYYLHDTWYDIMTLGIICKTLDVVF